MNILHTEESEVRAVAKPSWKRWMRRALLMESDYRTRRGAVRGTFCMLLGFSAVLGVLAGLTLIYSIDLPQMDELIRYRPNTTTELLDIHGRAIGSFALERRVVVPYTDLPVALRDGIISIEDKSFERNWGVNPARALAAAYTDFHTNSKAQGSSTLTMQLTRNLFLSAQKTYGRKLEEIFLTLQIERRFTKQQIFALYANQIYLGHGTYGFEAGSEFYFSKHVKDLTLPECALLAALPKGPEAYSPLKYPERALRRRNLVLNEMMHDGKISPAAAGVAEAASLGLNIQVPPNSVAPYFIEEVRRQLEREYGVEEVHGAGLKVYTTLDLDLQEVANKAILNGVATYERRRGWKGHLQNVVEAGLDIDAYRHPDWVGVVIEPGAYVHGMVTEVGPRAMSVKVGTKVVEIAPEDWAWTQQWDGRKLVKVGDLVYVRVEQVSERGVRVSLQQDSGAQASMMAVDNSNGEVVAMVGGRDYALSQFNRATQSQRQAGSSFKPYVYTAAFEAGMKPSDTVVDGPVSFWSPSGWYTPHNYEAGYAGTMTLTNAFAESRNIPALRLADKVGIKTVIATAHRFGITSNIPAFLPVAIGAADLTLAEQVGAYTVFPNDGIRIAPHYIRRVTEADGVPLDAKMPQVTEVISVETARQMMTLLQAVVQHGTAAAASSLHHPLGGKTGTTNDFTDAWFIGFSPSITCGTWIGFDTRETLGPKEQGAKAALPMWMEFMKVAIADKPDEFFPKDGAPKKVLEVPVTPSAIPEESKPSTDESDPDAQVVGDTPKAEAPADAPGVPAVPGGTVPARPTRVPPRPTDPPPAVPAGTPKTSPLPER